MPRPKKELDYPPCPVCGKPMPIPNSIDMQRVTGRAGWHMSFEPHMQICDECSKELLSYVEKWFKARNKTNTYKKFVYKKET